MVNIFMKYRLHLKDEVYFYDARTCAYINFLSQVSHSINPEARMTGNGLKEYQEKIVCTSLV